MALSHLKFFNGLKNIYPKTCIYLQNRCIPIVAIIQYNKPLLVTGSPSFELVSGKKTVAEELGLPNPPKRPHAPFIRYVLGEWKKYSDLKVTDKISKLSQDWLALNDSAKSTYVNSYNSELEVFRKEHSEYMDSLTPKQIQEMKELKAKKKIEKKVSQDRRMARKDSETLGKPKHPGNAVSLYSETIKKEGNYPKDNFLKYTIEQWHKLSETEKEGYKETSRKYLLQYKEELTKWEARMCELGRTDLVRKETVAVNSKSSETK